MRWNSRANSLFVCRGCRPGECSFLPTNLQQGCSSIGVPSAEPRQKSWENNSEAIRSTRAVCPLRRLLCHLLCSGNRFNHHHFSHHAAFYRCTLAGELVQFNLALIQRVNLLSYDQQRTSSLSSRILGCTLPRFLFSPWGERHTWSRRRFWSAFLALQKASVWLVLPRCARRHLHLGRHEHGGKCEKRNSNRDYDCSSCFQ